MENIVIKNSELSVEISPLGAEMQSIKNSNGKELLWQGNPEYWSGRSTNLFPFIGRLYEERYTHNGNSYPMTIHGFAKKMIFGVNKTGETEVEFVITDDENTKQMYPFSFRFSIKYILDANKLSVVYTVKNNSNDVMYFSIGGHPGFNMPLSDGFDFSDYYLEMDADNVMRSTTTDNKLMSGNSVLFTEFAEGRVNLKHELFDDDAFILSNTNGSVTLKSDKDDSYIKAEYPSLDYCAFWHTPQTQAPYICIEPWSGIPGRDVMIEELSAKPDMLSLSPKCEADFKIDYSIFVR